MTHVDVVYNKLAKTILTDGFSYLDKSRDNIEMLEIPSYTLDIDITQGFPLITTKQIYWKLIAHELIWMLSGSTNIDYLIDNNVNIWTEDVFNYSKSTYAGRIYGAQWRSWTSKDGPIDQVKNLVQSIKAGNLHNRRQLVTAWNPAELHEMVLPPCHWAFQVIPTAEGFGIKWHQRSCDTFLGIPFDIGLYAFLGKLLERELRIPFTRLIGDLSCVHFYSPHIPLIEEQLAREGRFMESTLSIANGAKFENLKIEDFVISNYKPHKPIKAKLYTKINTKINGKI